MEFIENMKMLLSDLTIEQFKELVLCFLSFFTTLFLKLLLTYYIVKFILNILVFLFRKDKYKEPDYIRLKGFRLICRLRKQAENAPTEKAYFLYYNRLLGALLLMTELGIIPRGSSPKLFDVKGKYEE